MDDPFRSRKVKGKGHSDLYCKIGFRSIIRERCRLGPPNLLRRLDLTCPVVGQDDIYVTLLNVKVTVILNMKGTKLSTGDDK